MPFRFNIPPVVKNLIIISVLFFIATNTPITKNLLYEYLSLWNFSSDNFNPYQLITYIFLHAPIEARGIEHLIFNMFPIFIFGRVLERVWGSKRFLTFGLRYFHVPIFCCTLENEHLWKSMFPQLSHHRQYALFEKC